MLLKLDPVALSMLSTCGVGRGCSDLSRVFSQNTEEGGASGVVILNMDFSPFPDVSALALCTRCFPRAYHKRESV